VTALTRPGSAKDLSYRRLAAMPASLGLAPQCCCMLEAQMGLLELSCLRFVSYIHHT